MNFFDLVTKDFPFAQPHHDRHQHNQVARAQAFGEPRFPVVHAAESETQYTFRVELPGYNKDNVNVEITDDRYLTVSAKMEENKTSEEQGADGEGQTTYTSSMSQSFFRKWKLPGDADAAKVAGNMEHGVLALTVPKVTAEAAVKQVTIN